MSGALRLLVTGFGAFGEHAENPSGLMARAVSGRVYHGVEVVAVEVPVTWSGAFAAIAAAVVAHSPEALLMLGVADRPTLCFETLGRNAQGSRADVLGHMPSGTRIDEASPDTLASTLPFARLRTGPLPVSDSSDAGDYLCNHVLFRALAELATPGPRGFVHVPPLPSSGSVHAVALETLLAAGEALVESLCAALAADLADPESEEPPCVPTCP